MKKLSRLVVISIASYCLIIFLMFQFAHLGVLDGGDILSLLIDSIPFGSTLFALAGDILGALGGVASSIVGKSEPSLLGFCKDFTVILLTSILFEPVTQIIKNILGEQQEQSISAFCINTVLTTDVAVLCSVISKLVLSAFFQQLTILFRNHPLAAESFGIFVVGLLVFGIFAVMVWLLNVGILAFFVYVIFRFFIINILTLVSNYVFLFVVIQLFLQGLIGQAIPILTGWFCVAIILNVSGNLFGRFYDDFLT